MRTQKSVLLKNSKSFKKKLLRWSQQFDDVVWLDSNDFNQINSNFDVVLAIDAFTSLQSDYYQAFNKLKEYQTTTNDWIFGYLSYDLKNDTEQLQSQNFDSLGFPDIFFFQPKKIFFHSAVITLFISTSDCIITSVGIVNSIFSLSLFFSIVVIKTVPSLFSILTIIEKK